MNRCTRRLRVACLSIAVLAFACSHDVPLGSWGRASGGALGGNESGRPAFAGSGGSESGGAPSPAGGTSGVGGAPDLAGSSGTGATAGSVGTSGTGGRPNLGCDDVGNPGGRNARGDGVGITLTQSQWSWPAPVESMEWEMRVENQPKADGYLIAYEFGFAGEAVGFVGVQANGLYQADPPNGTVVRSNMIVFWISDAPLDAAVGDFPESRTYREVGTFPTIGTTSANWLTVNARYVWEACKTYRFRVGKTTDPSDEGVWYGAWVRDVETNEEVQLGRILVPAAWEGLDDSSNAWSNRIGYATVNSCDDPEPMSVFFATPSADGGNARPTELSNEYLDAKCATSRFTEFSNGVRQEIGLAP